MSSLCAGSSVDDLEVAARVVFGKSGADFDPAPIPYREVDLPKKLRFGYYTSGAERDRVAIATVGGALTSKSCRLLYQGFATLSTRRLRDSRGSSQRGSRMH